VAFGTSAPELVVNLISAFDGQAALAFGNVLGSNIFNILAILGLTAILCPVAIRRNTTRFEVPLVFLSALLALVFFGNGYRDMPPTYLISRVEGIVLLVFFVAFMIYVLRMSKESEEVPVKPYTLVRAILFVVIGLAGLAGGGRLLVVGAVAIAESWGVSQRIIAITILSVGTSLPELATSIVAARRKNVDMAVGNVIGSNLFNLFLVLGLSATITPLQVTRESILDVAVNLLASLLLFLFIFTGGRRQIDRWEGILLALLYIAYVIVLTGG
jgi:cation:H+ antiporter